MNSKWIGRVVELRRGREVQQVRIMEFDGEWFWAVRA